MHHTKIFATFESQAGKDVAFRCATPDCPAGRQPDRSRDFLPRAATRGGGRPPHRHPVPVPQGKVIVEGVRPRPAVPGSPTSSPPRHRRTIG
jgi:hypothetical protein